MLERVKFPVPERDNQVTRNPEGQVIRAHHISPNSQTSANLTFKEAADRLRCSKGQFSKLICGKVKGVPPLKVVRLGRRVVVREQTLQEWLLEAETCNADR